MTFRNGKLCQMEVTKPCFLKTIFPKGKWFISLLEDLTGHQAKSSVYSSLRRRSGGGHPRFHPLLGLWWVPLAQRSVSSHPVVAPLPWPPRKQSLAEQLDSYLQKMRAPGSQCRIACLQGVATSLEGGRGMGDHIHFELGCLELLLMLPALSCLCNS